jgi:hypothetical protein
MLEFLSAAWLDALDRAAAASPAPGRSDGDRRLVVQQRVHDGPGGDTTYHLVFDETGLRVQPGTPEAFDVSFDTDYDTAVAISSGAESAQAAFMDGRLRIGGNIHELLHSHDLLLAVDDVFAVVRAETAY